MSHSVPPPSPEGMQNAPKVVMESTAWQMGMRNAGITGIALLLFFTLTMVLIWLVSHKSLQAIFPFIFALYLLATSACFYFYYVICLRKRGSVVYDCGYRSQRRSFLVSAFLLSLCCLTGAWHHITGPTWGMRIFFAVDIGSFYLLSAMGRMQICSHGIWAYTNLIKWQRIKTYRWNGNTLLLEYHTKWPLFGKGAISVSPQSKDVVETLLKDYLQTAAIGGNG